MQQVPSPAFHLDNLATGYRLRSGDKVLSSNLTAALLKGQLTCLLGTNGVGKSTLLRTMARFQPAISGQIDLFGKPLDSYSSNGLAKILGVVLTDKVPVGSLTAIELVSMGRLPYTGFWGGLTKADKIIVEEAIDQVGMRRFANRRLATLSDGERQKLMIAKALAQQTKVILLDEPIAFLDFPSKVDILDLLHRLACEEGKAILLSIHDLELALQTADCLWLLQGNGALVQGTPEALAREGKLDFFFSTHGLAFNHETLQYTFLKNNKAQ